MTEALRPSTLGEILDRTAHLYRARFLVFFGIAAMPAGIVLLCAAGVFLFFAWIGSWSGSAGQPVNPALVGAFSLLFLGGFSLMIVPLCAAAAGLGTAALNHAASAAFLDEKITIRDAYRTAWKRGWQYIWLYVLQALVFFVAPLVMVAALFVGLAMIEGVMGKPSNEAAALLAMLVLAVLALLAAYVVWMLLMLCLAFPACVTENVGAWQAVKRAVSLSNGTRWRMLALYLLGAVLGWGLSMVLTIPVIIAVSLIPGLDTPQHSEMIGTIVFFAIYGSWFAVQAFTKPVYVIALMVFYYDQRIRKEGFDIEWMMRQAGMVPAPAALPWMPELANKNGTPQPAAESATVGASPGATDLQPSVSPVLNAVDPAAPTGEPA